MTVSKMKQRIDHSFDLETFGTKRNSYITAIGCAKFDIQTGKVFDTFYMRTRCPTDLGFKIDVDTVQWWLRQSEEARAEMANHDRVHMFEALHVVSDFIGADDKVWGNGATFDISLLEDAYELLNGTGLTVPWRFWNIRDMRTIIDLAEMSSGFSVKSITREGTHHNALDDAIHQAKVISAAYADLK